MMETQTVLLDIGLLDITKINFKSNESGLLDLEYDGKTYKRVTLRRALPQKMPDHYVAVWDSEQKEIGMLKDLSLLPKEQIELVRKELFRRYFTPQVLDILSVKDKMGYLYFEVKLPDTQKIFALKDVSRNIIPMGDRILMVDVDGNRYMISDVKKLPPRAFKKLEAYLY